MTTPSLLSSIPPSIESLVLGRVAVITGSGVLVDSASGGAGRGDDGRGTRDDEVDGLALTTALTAALARFPNLRDFVFVDTVPPLDVWRGALIACGLRLCGLREECVFGLSDP
jgi:hypothetical protein